MIFVKPNSSFFSLQLFMNYITEASVSTLKLFKDKFYNYLHVFAIIISPSSELSELKPLDANLESFNVFK